MEAPARWAGSFRVGNEQGSTSRRAAPGARPGAERPRCGRQGADERVEPVPRALLSSRGVFRTARTVESAARQREALVALGTLAAGRGHELNNRAAAATRAVDALGDACDVLLSAVGCLAGTFALGGAAPRTHCAGPRGRPCPSGDRSRPMGQADREDAVSDWLNWAAVGDPHQLVRPAGASWVWTSVMVDARPDPRIVTVGRWRRFYTTAPHERAQRTPSQLPPFRALVPLSAVRPVRSRPRGPACTIGSDLGRSDAPAAVRRSQKQRSASVTANLDDEEVRSCTYAMATTGTASSPSHCIG